MSNFANFSGHSSMSKEKRRSTRANTPYWVWHQLAMLELGLQLIALERRSMDQVLAITFPCDGSLLVQEWRLSQHSENLGDTQGVIPQIRRSILGKRYIVCMHQTRRLPAWHTKYAGQLRNSFPLRQCSVAHHSEPERRKTSVEEKS
jgi:hypothetical protein